MDQGCLVPSGWSRSTGTGQCMNSSEPQCWSMIGKPGGRVLTERCRQHRSALLSHPPNSALADRRAQLVAKAVPKVVERKRRWRSGAEVWKYGPPR